MASEIIISRSSWHAVVYQYFSDSGLPKNKCTYFRNVPIFTLLFACLSVYCFPLILLAIIISKIHNYKITFDRIYDTSPGDYIAYQTMVYCFFGVLGLYLWGQFIFFQNGLNYSFDDLINGSGVNNSIFRMMLTVNIITVICILGYSIYESYNWFKNLEWNTSFKKVDNPIKEQKPTSSWSLFKLALKERFSKLCSPITWVN